MKKEISFTDIIILLATTHSQKLFLSSFLIGSAFIIANYHVLLFPPLIVFLFAAILFGAQRYHVSLSEQNRDSTYLLGFIFTLMCFIRIFWALDVVSDTFSTVIIPQIGSALLTSVVGLVARFIIIHNDKGSADQEEIWRNATNELKENAKAYRNAQVKLTKLIDNFVETREKLFTEEQKASKDHITLLSKSSNALADISENYPSTIKEMLRSLDDIKDRYKVIQEKSEKFLTDNIFDKYDELDSKVNEYYEQLTTRNLKNYEIISEKFSSLYDESIKQISDKLQEMQGKVNSLFDENVFKNFDELNTNTLRYYQSINDKFISTYQETFGQITAKLNETQATIGQFQTLLHKAFQHIPDIQDDFLKSSVIKLENLHGEFLTRLNTNFHQLNGTFEKIDNELNVTNSKLTDYNKLMGDGVKSSITNIRSGIEDLGTSLSDLNTNIGQSSATLNDNIDSLNENIIKRLHIFNDEIREIDELINKFLDITKNRIIS